MHQHATLLSDFTVAALRPARRAERNEVQFQPEQRNSCEDVTVVTTRGAPTKCWGPTLLGGWSQSHPEAQHVYHGVPLQT